MKDLIIINDNFYMLENRVASILFNNQLYYIINKMTPKDYRTCILFFLNSVYFI